MIANRWQKHYHLLVFRGLMKRYVTSWVCCFKMFLSKKTGGWCSHYSLSPAANQVHANFESCGSCSSNIPFQKKNSSLNWAPYSFLRFPSILPRIQGCCFLKYFFCFEPIDEKKMVLLLQGDWGKRNVKGGNTPSLPNFLYPKKIHVRWTSMFFRYFLVVFWAF